MWWDPKNLAMRAVVVVSGPSEVWLERWALLFPSQHVILLLQDAMRVVQNSVYKRWY